MHEYEKAKLHFPDEPSPYQKLHLALAQHKSWDAGCAMNEILQVVCMLA